jgi:hypothetical protein
MNPFTLSGKYLQHILPASVGIGINSVNKDPVNRAAGLVFGIPFATQLGVGALGINAGATAPGTLDEARRLGWLK